MKWLRSGIFIVALIITAKAAPTLLDADDEDSLRLPKSSFPISYDLTLTTDVHTGSRMFNGFVRIEIEIAEVTTRITLHNRQLRIQDVDFKTAAGTNVDFDWFEDWAKDFLHLEFLVPLAPGSRYTIEVTYSGLLQTGTSGFYGSTYKVGTETRYLAATQFESTNARYAFVCYDEPEYKATFKLTIVHGSSYNAIANTEGSTIDNLDGTSTTSFEVSPRMSTYLLAFLVSDFTYTSNAEGLAEGATLHRVYARSSDVHRTEFALDSSIRLLRNLESYAQFSYEIPKMWSAAIPDFGAGAMENWGLITYKEQYLIGDENSHPRDVLEILKTVAHEIGHQFFGNVVTCKWWDEIWLNEGFATFFEYHLVDMQYIDLRMRDYFNVQKLQNTLRIDALETTRAMNSYAETPDAISGLFDRVAYDKSGSVIRMFQFAVGATIFRNSLRQYLTTYTYQPVTSSDLYESFETVISEAGGVGFDFTAAFKSWELTKGFPMIHVSVNENSFQITQQRYYALNEERVQGDTRSWYIPLSYVTESNPNFEDTRFTDWFPAGDSVKTIAFPEDFNTNQWFIFNKQQIGVYRVNYDAQNWNRIIEVLNSDNFKEIHVLNRAQLVEDSLSLAMDGYLDYEIAFGVLSYLSRETDYIPWRAIVTNLDKLDYMLAGRTHYNTFKTFVIRSIRRMYLAYGLEEKPVEILMDRFARELAIDWTCRMGDPECLADTWSLLKKAVDEDLEIPDSLEITYICNGLKGENRLNEFVALWRRMDSSDDQAKRLRYLDGLMCSLDYQALFDLLQSTSGGNINYRTHEITRIFNNLHLKSSVGMTATIDYISKHFDEAINTFSMSSIESLLIAMSRRVSIYEQQVQLTEILDNFQDRISSSTRETVLKNIDDNKSYIGGNDYFKILTYLFDYEQTIMEIENVLRLPKTSVPQSYKIHIDARNVHTGALPFTGEVEIDVLIQEATSVIVMHSKTQVINEIQVVHKNSLSEIPVLMHSLYPAVDTLTIYFSESLPANSEILVTIKYSTNLPTFGSGFYRTSYVMNGATRYVAATQFQPAHARYAFPHYDEPGYKVPFDLKITHNEAFTAIANTFGTDVVNEDGTITTTFETTPPMSSYLLAFVVSDFEYITNELTKGENDTLHRVWVRPDSITKADYALENSELVLKALEDYVDFKFELPKVDSAAIPNKGGAMENWGMVTYWETAMIYEEDFNDISHAFRLSGVNVIAHELAHQFFGDSVTCEWWDVTWLNEGFATLFEFYISQILYPHWNTRHFFNLRKLHSAFRFDATDSTRAMTFNVETLGEISTSFNTIGYDKSGSVLRMIQYVVGEEIFRSALNLYLNTNNHKTARTPDLVAAFATTMAARGLTTFNFDALFRTWELQAGVPLVTVTRTNSGQFNVTQQRFFATKRENSDDTSSWYIPLNFATAANPNFDDTTITNYFVNGESNYVFPVAQFDANQWFVFNKQQLSYYRVNYDSNNWNALISVLNSDDYNKIHVLNRVQLVDDSITLAAGGYLDYETTFGILTYLVRETEYTPWFSADRFISTLYTTFGTANPELRTFIRRLTGRLYDAHKLPSNNIIPHEDVYERYNREIAIRLACNSGNEQCLADTATLNHYLATEDRHAPMGLANNIYCNGFRGTDNQDDWVLLWRKMASTSDATLKTTLISALGCTDDQTALKDYLESTLGAGNSVNYTQAQRRNVLSAVLNSYSGLEVVIKFFEDFEIYIMSSYGYTLETLLNIVAGTIKSKEQFTMFNYYLSTLTHLADDAFRRVTTTASASLQLQSQPQNVFFLDLITKINQGAEVGVTTVPPVTSTETQTSTVVETIPTVEETVATTDTTTTQGASAITVKFVTIFTSVFIAYSLKY